MPTIAEALQLAAGHHQSGRLFEAEQIYRQILTVEPNHEEAIGKLFELLYRQQKYELSLEIMLKAIAVNPFKADYYNKLGIAYESLKMLEDAISSYRYALRLNPNLYETYNNLGVALRLTGKFDEAIESYQIARQKMPYSAEIVNNLGSAFRFQGKSDLAIKAYQEALSINPDYGLAHFNLALMLLLAGNYEEGWREYEWRWQVKPQRGTLPHFHQPIWNGESLQGKTLLILCEQGLGDTFQFIRYAALLREQGTSLVIMSQRPLLKILNVSFPTVKLVPLGEDSPNFDYYIPLLSLPRVFQSNSHSIPARVPYLLADQNLVDHWKRKFAGTSGYRIGINYRSGMRADYGNFQYRNIPLHYFLPIAKIPNVQMINIQKGDIVETEQSMIHKLSFINNIDEVDELSGPFMDTAAIMMNLDLVITSDTSIAHLAGALGIPVWIALPSVPDWRWLLDREDSPWYPTMRLFRQTKQGEWGDVFERMVDFLASRVRCADQHFGAHSGPY